VVLTGPVVAGLDTGGRVDDDEVEVFDEVPLLHAAPMNTVTTVQATSRHLGVPIARRVANGTRRPATSSATNRDRTGTAVLPGSYDRDASQGSVGTVDDSLPDMEVTHDCWSHRFRSEPTYGERAKGCNASGTARQGAQEGHSRSGAADQSKT